MVYRFFLGFYRNFLWFYGDFLGFYNIGFVEGVEGTLPMALPMVLTC